MSDTAQKAAAKPAVSAPPVKSPKAKPAVVVAPPPPAQPQELAAVAAAPVEPVRATSPAVVALKVVPKALKPTSFAQASEFVIPFNHVELPAGHTLEDCLKPAYWAHVAKKMQGRGRILVDAEDGSFSAQLKIHSASDLSAVVSVEWKSEGGAAAKERATSKADEYRVHHVGARAKWRISRLADNATISEGHETEEIARRELQGYLQALAA